MRSDGRGVLFVRQSHLGSHASDGLIYVWHAGSATPGLLNQSRDVKDWPQWSPNGRQIAYYSKKGWTGGGFCDWGACPYEIWVADANGSNARQVTTDATSIYGVVGAGLPSWSPDGHRIVYMRDFATGSGRTIGILDLRTGKERGLGGGGGWPVWGRPGIAELHRSEIRLVNPRTGQWKLFAKTPSFPGGYLGDQAAPLAWSHAGKLAALETSTGRLVAIYTSSGRKIRTFRIPTSVAPNVPGSQACGITWSPDGKQLLITTGAQQPDHLHYWNVYKADADGKHWRLLPIHPSTCTTSWR
jgi:Tol biopolymer transport system component